MKNKSTGFWLVPPERRACRTPWGRSSSIFPG